MNRGSIALRFLKMERPTYSRANMSRLHRVCIKASLEPSRKSLLATDQASFGGKRPNAWCLQTNPLLLGIDRPVAPEEKDQIDRCMFACFLSLAPAYAIPRHWKLSWYFRHQT